MTGMKITVSAAATKALKIGTIFALAASITTPLFAQDTVVEGKAKRSDVVERRISYSDLDLTSSQNQLVLVSRVRKAASKVCDILYHGQSPMMKFETRCPQSVYREAKPQIDLAIANAGNGTRVAKPIDALSSRRKYLSRTVSLAGAGQ